MGSVCCTAARARDMAEASDRWSMEQTGHVNQRGSHGALSPPPVSSQWERKSHFSETGVGRNSMSFHRTTSSSNRSYRSNSNSISSESHGTSSLRLCGTADGLLAIFNSPSESFRYSQRSFDHVTDSVTAVTSEPVLRRSTAYSNQGLPTSSVTLASTSQKTLEDSDCVHGNKQVKDFPKLGLSTSKTRKHSRQGLEPSFSFEGFNTDNMTSVASDSYQQMMRNSVDVPLSYSRQKSAGSWKIRGFSDLVESSRPGSSRWSSMGISSNIFVDGDQEDFNDLYIRSTGAMHHHDLGAAPLVEIDRCGLCAKAISQKSLWSFSRVLGSKDLPVVGILDCGHVYHAECLDQATPLMEAHDPPCPKCEEQKKADKTKTIGLKERSFMRGKLSRVGVSTAEDFADVEPSRSYQPVWNHSGLSESLSKKGAPYLSAHNTEKGISTKSLLRRQFSFRGKLSRESISSNSGSKRPGYPARVSPENNIREDDLIVTGEKCIN